MKGIAKENVFYGSAVGIAGSSPDQWERSEALETKVDEKALMVLTDHSNAVVRCYAFQGLVNKNSKDVFNLLVKHLTDTAQIQTLFGCVGHTEKVGDFFLGLAISGSDNYQLNQAQRALIDSVLIYDKKASLAAKGHLLDTLKPESRHYGRIREMAITEHNSSTLACCKTKSLPPTAESLSFLSGRLD